MFWRLMLAAVLGSFVMIGCTEKQEEAAEETGQKMEAAAEKTGDAIADTTAQSATTGKVKSALISSSEVSSDNINVDTLDMVIHLRGSVPTAEQRAKAEEIAKLIAGDEYTVMNHLEVKAEGEKNMDDNNSGS